MRRKEEQSKQAQTNNKAKHVYIILYNIIHVLMRDEKEGREKQAKQQGKAPQHTQGSHLYIYAYKMHARCMMQVHCCDAGTLYNACMVHVQCLYCMMSE